MMSIKQYPFLLTIIYLLFFSCAPVDTNQIINASNRTHQMVTKETVRIPIDKSTSIAQSKYMLMVEQGKEYLYVYNRPVNTIQVYDLEKRSLVNTTGIPFRGPESPDYAEMFYPFALDSLLIISPKAFSANLYDGQGRKVEKKRWITDPDIHKNPSVYGMSHIFTTYTNIPYEKGGDLYFPAMDQEARESPDRYETATTVEILNWKKGTVKSIYKYPEIYKMYNFSFLTIYHHRTLGEGGLFVHGFEADPYVYRTDYDEINEKKYAGSSLIPDPTPLRGSVESTTSDDRRQARWTTSKYSALLYDKYRGFYYRFVVGPQNLDASVTELERSSDQFSIIILDKKLNIVGEWMTPTKSYNCQFAFISKSGLYLSTSHPLNDEVNEDFLEFDVLIPEITQ